MRGDILVLDAGETLIAARHLSDRLDQDPDIDGSDEQVYAALRLLSAAGYRVGATLRRLDAIARAREQTPGGNGPTPPAVTPPGVC